MSSLDTLLDELQLACEPAGPVDIIPPPPQDTAQAAGWFDTDLTFDEMRRRARAWRAIPAPGAEGAGWSVAGFFDGARVLALAVVLTSGGGVSVASTADQDPGSISSVDTEHPNEALIRILPDTPVVVRADNSLLGITVRPDGTLAFAPLQISGEYARTPLPSPPTDQAAPVDTSNWLHADAPAWLRDAVDQQVGIGGVFHTAVAAGLALRLDHAGVTRRAPRGGLAALLEAAKRAPGPAHAWVHALPSDRLLALEAFATAEAERLWQRLEPIAERTAPHDPSWCEALAELLRSRDDLSCAYRVLIERDRATALGAALAAFDRVARREIAALPIRGLVSDPRLEASVSANSDAWWGMPARS